MTTLSSVTSALVHSREISYAPSPGVHVSGGPVALNTEPAGTGHGTPRWAACGSELLFRPGVQKPIALVLPPRPTMPSMQTLLGSSSRSIVVFIWKVVADSPRLHGNTCELTLWATTTTGHSPGTGCQHWLRSLSPHTGTAPDGGTVTAGAACGESPQARVSDPATTIEHAYTAAVAQCPRRSMVSRVMLSTHTHTLWGQGQCVGVPAEREGTSLIYTHAGALQPIDMTDVNSIALVTAGGYAVLAAVCAYTTGHVISRTLGMAVRGSPAWAARSAILERHGVILLVCCLRIVEFSLWAADSNRPLVFGTAFLSQACGFANPVLVWNIASSYAMAAHSISKVFVVKSKRGPWTHPSMPALLRVGSATYWFFWLLGACLAGFFLPVDEPGVTQLNAIAVSAAYNTRLVATGAITTTFHGFAVVLLCCAAAHTAYLLHGNSGSDEKRHNLGRTRRSGFASTRDATVDMAVTQAQTLSVAVVVLSLLGVAVAAAALVVAAATVRSDNVEAAGISLLVLAIASIVVDYLLLWQVSASFTPVAMHYVYKTTTANSQRAESLRSLQTHSLRKQGGVAGTRECNHPSRDAEESVVTISSEEEDVK